MFYKHFLFESILQIWKRNLVWLFTIMSSRSSLSFVVIDQLLTELWPLDLVIFLGQVLGQTLFCMYTYLFSIFLAQQALHLYKSLVLLSINDNEVIDANYSKVKGHFMIKARCQRNPYFLSSCYQINSKLVLKEAYDLPLSWLVLRANGLDLHGSCCRSKIAYPKVNFLNRLNHIV
jgi:hypothetical protein